MFEKIVIANRGEIAVRILRTAHEMGIATVAVYSDSDRDALHVRMAGEAYRIGPAAPALSYLNSDALIDVAHRSGAQAIHPGYGFLAENAVFARRVVAEGFIWIGPHADAIDAMGDKLRARTAMRAAGVPCVPGGVDAIDDVAGALEAARLYGLPLALKASGGGGGKGLKVARTLDAVESAFTNARREAEAYFKNGTIYAERYLENPKHIELQILADKHGNVLHVGERDCSLQRRHQKLWEEAPAHISATVADGLRDAGLRAARAIAYDSVGTIECLVSGDEFFFLEMNTRIQVEHTVSEMISGLDLIREQIRVAAGEPLGFAQEDITFRGWAIEGRVNAEDPARGFAPAPGRISAYREPGGPGVRVDSASFAGHTISSDYDSMIAKLIVWAPTRERALARMRRATDEFVIEGVPTTLPLLRALCDSSVVRDASYGTATLEPLTTAIYADDASTARVRVRESAPADASVGQAESDLVRVEVNGRLYHIRLLDLPTRHSVATDVGARRPPPRTSNVKRQATAHGDDVVSPMHGVVIELPVKPGDSVAEKQVVAVVEAMKMMNELRAHKTGTVATVHVGVGDTVESGAPLITIA
ncbi:MAG TPA: acetyl-CoA carboxylase biotin carboxylase subunit [Candidatus Baltobacteraceae bacterium]|nr:acetyl-CoA carboxylase biotin carboxylase subunit [Candidatus Baltobacteraceae bacterium]